MRLRKNTIALVAAASTLFITNASQGAVTFTFAEVGGDVVATVSGSFLAPPTGRQSADFSGARGADSVQLYATTSPIVSFWQSGSFSATTLFAKTFVNNLSDTFGYSNTNVYMPLSIGDGDSYTPNGNITWVGQSMASLGLTSLTTQLVYTAPGVTADTITFVNAVPEPSSALLSGVGVALLALHNRRRPLRVHPR